jgi:hypothetical protein
LEAALFEVILGNRTRVTSQAECMFFADPDCIIQFGMEKGINQGYERLDELLDKLFL